MSDDYTRLEKKFPIGTVVEVIMGQDNAKKGMRGIVKGYRFGSSVGVDFGDNFQRGHNLSGLIATTTGHWISESNLINLVDSSYD